MRAASNLRLRKRGGRRFNRRQSVKCGARRTRTEQGKWQRIFLIRPQKSSNSAQKIAKFPEETGNTNEFHGCPPKSIRPLLRSPRACKKEHRERTSPDDVLSEVEGSPDNVLSEVEGMLDSYPSPPHIMQNQSSKRLSSFFALFSHFGPQYMPIPTLISEHIVVMLCVRVDLAPFCALQSTPLAVHKAASRRA